MDGLSVGFNPAILTDNMAFPFDSPSKMAAYIKINFRGGSCEFIKTGSSSHEFALTFDSIQNALRLGLTSIYAEVGYHHAFSENQLQSDFCGSGTIGGAKDWEKRCRAGYDSGNPITDWGLNQMITDTNILNKFGEHFKLEYWRIKKGYPRYSRNYNKVSADGNIPWLDGWKAPFTNDTGAVQGQAYRFDNFNDGILYFNDGEGKTYTLQDKEVGLIMHGVMDATFTYGDRAGLGVELGNEGKATYDYSSSTFKENSKGDLFSPRDDDQVKNDDEGIFTKGALAPTLNRGLNPSLMYYYGACRFGAGDSWVDPLAYQFRCKKPTNDGMKWLYVDVDSTDPFFASFLGWYGPPGDNVGEIDNPTRAGGHVWPTMSFPVISYHTEAGQEGVDPAEPPVDPDLQKEIEEIEQDLPPGFDP